MVTVFGGKFEGVGVGTSVPLLPELVVRVGPVSSHASVSIQVTTVARTRGETKMDLSNALIFPTISYRKDAL